MLDVLPGLDAVLDAASHSLSHFWHIPISDDHPFDHSVSAEGAAAHAKLHGMLHGKHLHPGAFAASTKPTTFHEASAGPAEAADEKGGGEAGEAPAAGGEAAAGGEGGAGGEEKKGLEEVPTMELTGSAVFASTTLATFAFLHITGSDDPDLRRNAWDFVGTTLRMFVALMVFSIIDNFMRLLLIPTFPAAIDNPFLMAIIYIAPAIGVTVAMQYASLQTVSLTGFVKGIPSKAIRSIALCGMLAETTAGAWAFVINSLIDGCHEELHLDWPLIPLNFAAALVWLVVLVCSKTARDAIVFADGVVDPEEREWLEMAEGFEAEAGGMFLSFVTANILRYYIGNIMPDDEGNEHGLIMHRWSQIICLFTAGVLSVAVGASLSEDHKEHTERPQEQSSYSATWAELTKVYFFELAGWATLFAVQWTIQRQYAGREAGIMIRIGTAIVMTGISFGSIIGKVHELAGEENREAVKVALTTGLAVASGFAWERCFDDAFGSLAQQAAFLSFDDEKARLACGELCAQQEEAKLTIMLDTTSALVAYTALYYHVAPVVLELNGESKRDSSGFLRDQSDAGAGS